MRALRAICQSCSPWCETTKRDRAIDSAAGFLDLREPVEFAGLRRAPKSSKVCQNCSKSSLCRS